MFKRAIILVFTLIFFTLPAHADNTSPVGLWQIQDEETHQVSSIVSIQKSNDSITGKIVKIYNNPNAVCSKCSGDLHNKPLQGLTILWGFTANNAGWTNGKILAVKRGSVFDADLNLQKQGQQLLVQIKTPFGSKNQIWQRISAIKP